MISDVENSIRGFSFMPEIKIKEIDLQYVENTELEQSWRSTRRERQKQQEQKIWEEFIEEQDVVRSVYRSDPYQFIDQIPETCLKELLDKELNKIRHKEAEEDINDEEQCEISSSPSDTPLIIAGNTEIDQRECQDVLHICYDENDKEEMSSHDDEAVDDSGASPLCTVREKEEEKNESEPPEPKLNPEKASSKCSANIASGIENSIYCAKVKELRTRIDVELTSIIASVQRLNVMNIDPEDLKKILKRSSEFCSRFSRIHLYQLQRQIQDIKRNNSATPLPFAKHTQFQSQMLRIVSLHQNMLQAFCVFHKSLEQTQYIGDNVQLGLAASQLLRAAPAPAPPPPAAERLYRDDLLLTCDRLDEVLKEHGTKVEELIRCTEEAHTSQRPHGPPPPASQVYESQTKKCCDVAALLDNNPYAKKSSGGKGKQKPAGSWSKSGSKSSSRADGRLSMYSLDTLRINLKGKPSSTRNNQSSGTSKQRGSAGNACEKRAPVKHASPKSRRKAPVCGRGRGRLGGSRGEDVRTLVQAVACVSSHVSLEPSPHRSANTRDFTHRSKETGSCTKSKESTPTQRSLESSRRCQKLQNTPRSAYGHVNAKIESPGQRKSGERSAEMWKSGTEESSKDNLGHNGAESRRSDRGKTDTGAGGCEVTRLLRELCGGDASGKKKERISGTRNAQLHCVSSSSPRQPTTPQLLRILEESIQKKPPRQMNQKPLSIKDAEKFRMNFNISEKTVENLFQYRTKFVQHMLTSSMYANSAVEKPWEMVNSVSEQIIDGLLLACAKEMELRQVVEQLYECETR